jgi:ATP-dependent RNA helicase DeaD
MTTFENLGLKPELLKAVAELGFTTPSPIQEKAIPFVLKSRKDLVALAQTGTGKTAAFGLPILNGVNAEGHVLQSIILCPTRELCIQIARDVSKLGRYLKGLKVTPVYGGASIDEQVRALASGTNIVVGTPGRVHDLIRRKRIQLKNIEWLVLDEADEMLDMGFKDDLDAILDETPASRQTLLFSATISRSIQAIARRYMKDAQEISVGAKNVGAENVSHEYCIVNPRDRFEALQRILDSLPGVYGILFCRTKIETQEVADRLKGVRYDAVALHGDVSQSMRTRIMDGFKRKKSGLLVATDVAARGIDVSDLSHVINFSLPDTNESYTHRSGRTGRAQKTGVSISIIGARDTYRIRDLERAVGRPFVAKSVPTGHDIKQKQIASFLEQVANLDVDAVDLGDTAAAVAEFAKHHTKEELVKRFVAQQFQGLFTSGSSRDLNAAATEGREKGTRSKRLTSGKETTLTINLGRKRGFNLKCLFDLINGDQNLRGLDLGDIHLGPEESTFTVDSDNAEKVAEALSDTTFYGKRIIVTTAKPSARPDMFTVNRFAGAKRGGHGRR